MELVLGIACIFALVTLGGLNVYQFHFWGDQVKRLTAQVMSKNYTEYVQNEKNLNLPPRVSEARLAEIKFAEEKEEKEILDELNGKFN